MVMEFASIKHNEKLLRASPMNTVEEILCEECGQVIFEKEMYLICKLKSFNKEIIMKNFCCDCFEKKVNDDIDRIQNWSERTINELKDMKAPIQDYMNSEIKREIDINRTMLKKIEGDDCEGGDGDDEEDDEDDDWEELKII